LAQVEENDRMITKMLSNISTLDVQLDIFERENAISEIQMDIGETREQIHLIEERISSVNNIVHGLNVAIERQNATPESPTPPENVKDETAWIQTNIEAQLYLNLR